MVKRREAPAIPVDKKIEAFAAQADHIVTAEPMHDKDAKRDYKAIRVPFNEYEFAQLEALCEKTQRSKLNMIRYALAFYAEHGQNELP
ncbi:hypothetical protein CYR55_14645 [Chimaeribacter californicus]|jgi:hypothetical protein|uniref:Uncharacterized protein n=1 Tax=Chimaeribacter californicus TaxID=2060067 RepID=A0A2N5E252_9GAMM|nr:hypothetical protein [Chimaeribacter californicus]PLR34639.1 hypothetical protein CYR55_14645 [Chimaeribacter californicus]